MCITFFCSCPDSKGALKFALSFNREERTERQTLKLAQFHEDPNIYGGRDAQTGGTWLGINIQTGLLVFLTNYITLSPCSRQGISRGKIVSHFLLTSFIPEAQKQNTDEIVYKELQLFSKQSLQFSPFNLVICNLRTGSMHYLCSEWQKSNPLKLKANQVYGLSNSDILTEWNKTKHGSSIFKTILQNVDQINQSQLFEKIALLMQNTEKHNDLPDGYSTIFVEPHWNERIKAERRTKQTTIILSYEKQGKKEIVIQQITYEVNEKSEVLLRLII